MTKLTKHLTLPGIPESVPIEHVRALITSLGIDVEQLTRDGVTLGWHAITCTLYATDPAGDRFLNETGTDAAVHTVRIRVEHPKDTE